MIPPESYSTFSLANHPHGAAITRILASAIEAVAPGEAIRRNISISEMELTVGLKNSEGEPECFNLNEFKRIKIIALGKAAAAMTEALTNIFKEKIPQIPVKGLMIVKRQTTVPDDFEQIVGGHPVPDEGSLLAGQKLTEFLSDCASTDLLICLISGGGSALMTSPHAGVSLKDIQTLTTVLLECGARIDEINILRRHLDRVKGGGLAKMAFPATMISLILSDVVGNPLETIASGPTAPDPSRLSDAVGIIEKYNLTGKIPVSIMQLLNIVDETPKPGDKIFERVKNVLVGSNVLAARAALQQAECEGLTPWFLGADWQGEARQVSDQFCEILKTASETGQPVYSPFCLVAGGETTVTLTGKGRGGRNQELALAAVENIRKIPGSMLITLATDGEDGPTDAAGAVVTPETANRAEKLHLNTAEFLNNNDAYNYFSNLGDLLNIGPTGTNVNDLTFLFNFGKSYS